MKKLLLWLQQPTSVAGISTVIGAAAALALHQIDLVQAAPLFAAAIASIVLPDNAGARNSAELLARSLVTKTTTTQDKS